MKVVVNRCYGGFSVSDAVMEQLHLPLDKDLAARRVDWNSLYNSDLGITSDDHYAFRSDPRLVAAVEALGSAAASGKLAKLEVVELPDDVAWTIEEYDGNEWVAEQHRTYLKW